MEKSSKVNHYQEKQNNEMDMEEIEMIDAAEHAHMDVDNANEEFNEAAEYEARAKANIVFKTFLRDLREPQLSSIFYVRGLPWQIKLEQSSTRIPRTLGFYLRCNGVPQPSTWSCVAVAELRLLKHWDKPSIYSVDNAFSRKICYSYNANERESGFSAFISWEDLCDPRRGFLMDNSIEVEAYVKVDVPRIAYDVGPNVKLEEHEASSYVTYHIELSKVSAFRGKRMYLNLNIHNMPFQLVLQAIPKKEPVTLGVFLVCLGDPKTPLWCCYLEATLKLMNQNSTGEICSRTFQHLFCRNENRYGFPRFVHWKRFLDSRQGFVKNDTIYFEIKVRADASVVSEVQIDRSNLSKSGKEIKMLYTIYNISQLKNELFTSTFYVCNLPWRIKLMLRTCIGPTRQIQKYLSIYLQCTQESEEAWSCNATAMFILLKNGSEECGRDLHYLFSKQKNCSGFSHFIPWTQLLDPEAGLTRNDSVVLLICLKAAEP